MLMKEKSNEKKRTGGGWIRIGAVPSGINGGRVPLVPAGEPAPVEAKTSAAPRPPGKSRR